MRSIIRPFFLSLALVSFAHQARAFETRFAIDPKVNVQQLAQSGEVVSRADRVGDTLLADASAVLRVPFNKLWDASLDYDHYVEMGMPNLKESHLVVRDSVDHLYTWSRMQILTLDSSHYLEVRALRGLTPSGAVGSEWQLASRQANWQYPDASAFGRLEGSWYMEPLPDGSIYVRYFLSAVVETGIPDFLVDLVAKKHFREGVRGVIQALAKRASK
jgi:hypothetical protein